MLESKVKKFIENGVSLKQLSLLAGIHYTTLSKWLNGERKISEKTAENIIKSMKKEIDILKSILEE